ncbi:MAG: hypothetical protein JOS17DRAFT_731609 [Linnemannia elongata]|nr:MAG: hypothetical protein JOS17DRAFT_731609 [Linnemannia elongata]
MEFNFALSSRVHLLLWLVCCLFLITLGPDRIILDNISLSPSLFVLSLSLSLSLSLAVGLSKSTYLLTKGDGSTITNQPFSFFLCCSVPAGSLSYAMHFLLFVFFFYFSMSLERIVRSENEAQYKLLLYGPRLSLFCLAPHFIREKEHGSEPQMSKRVRARSACSLEARPLAGHFMCMPCLSSMNKQAHAQESKTTTNGPTTNRPFSTARKTSSRNIG